MSDQQPDHLRTPETICNPDERNYHLMILDNESYRQRTLDDQYEEIEKLTLNACVPDGVNVQFETSKNIYLYAWFVYRFYPVARHHALTVLELALRERFDEEIGDKSNYRSRDGRLYLKSLLRYCRDNGVLINDGFEAARRRAEHNARDRIILEMINEMDEKGLMEMTLDDSTVDVRDTDREFDYVEKLTTSLPNIRNAHAHGSKMLDNHAYGVLQSVAEIINQLWPEKS